MEFRTLNANEIEVKPAKIMANGLSLLLYKDARCDMNILDETVGSLNWKREHTRENANCIVSIWDAQKAQWVSKEDTGTESATEKEKGLASDSFKRACFNWGIGRELYTAPFIWIPAEHAAIKQVGENYISKERFSIEKIAYDTHKNITGLAIQNSQGKRVYVWQKRVTENPQKA